MTDRIIREHTYSPDETELLGEEIAKKIHRGTTILLYGELGAGKTTMTRGICRAFGIDMVKSPSFVMVNVYAGRGIDVYHIDLYRVSELDSETAGEIGEYLWDDDAIKIVEWAENLLDEIIPEKVVAVKIERVSDTEREITIEGDME